MITADEALDRLFTGNRRFVDKINRSGTAAVERYIHPVYKHTGEPVQEQQPFAVILGCSDARVPIETIFDQQAGELFIIRVAGNVVASPVTGSIEYSVLQHHCKLIVVLGHSHCGAVQAAVTQLREPATELSANLHELVDLIRPALRDLDPMADRTPDEETGFIAQAVKANIRASKARLLESSTILRSQTEDNDLRIVGAEYSLATGQVTFLD